MHLFVIGLRSVIFLNLYRESEIERTKEQMREKKKMKPATTTGETSTMQTEIITKGKQCIIGMIG